MNDNKVTAEDIVGILEDTPVVKISKKSKIGDTKKNAAGYILVKVQDKPSLWKKQHIVLAEERMGRKLKEDEIVHHIDGGKGNNELSNLRVMTRADHAALHHTKNSDMILESPIMDTLSSVTEHSIETVEVKYEVNKELYQELLVAVEESDYSMNDVLIMSVVNQIRILNNDMPVLTIYVKS